jgi:short-subunit dehydrogenase
MRGRGRGQIVLVSSVLGEFGIPYSATYVASKHAVNGLVKSLRHEFKGTGVRVWAALPGRFASEFRFHALGDRAEPGKPIGGEPVEAVARGILRGLDRDHAFHYPTWTAWATVAASRWCRIPFDWWMGYWGRPHFAREMGRSQT